MNKNALQRHRVNRVIDVVRKSGAEPMTLDEMADVACLSRYHFARVFTEHCGETPIEFLTRSRLEKSVSALVAKPDLPITSIALEVGFSGSQAFSHAFRRRYGVGPRRFRDANRGCVIDFPKNQWWQYPMLAATSPSASPMPSLSAALRRMPETRVAYIRHIGPYFNMPSAGAPTGGIADTIDRLLAWAKRQGIWHDNTTVFGICPNNPSITPPQYCQYDVCIEVDETVTEDDIVSIQHMPATRFAAVEVTGDSGALMRAWRWLGSYWLPRTGLCAGLHTPFEMYQVDGAHPICPENGMTLCMPVVDDPQVLTLTRGGVQVG